jgi:very-short-patch-repair endonuclease
VKHVFDEVAAGQHGVVSVWQLRAAGLSVKEVRRRIAGLRGLHDGVFVTGHAPVSRVQRWWAATLTAPGSVLSFASAAAAWEIRPWEGPFEVVTRRGSGGPRRQGGLLLCRSTTLDHTTLHGFAITTPERTIRDLWPRLDEREQRKLLREALRLQQTTVPQLRRHLDAAPLRSRPRTLTQTLARYERLGLERCRSDAEAYAIEVLDAARIALPRVNTIIAGLEADLSWPTHRLIVEIDGANYHRDKPLDADKTRTWTAAGWRVRRAEADEVFHAPQAFVDYVCRWLTTAPAR